MKNVQKNILLALILSTLLLCLILHPVLAASDRVALVIGNGSYKNSPLKNPGRDADSMAHALSQLGFKVIKGKNLNRKQIRSKIRDFGRALKNARVGLFYYAGHGVQYHGDNFLIPIKADINEEYEIKDEAISASTVLRSMESAGNPVNLVILDACRNNPYARSFRSASRGLSRMDGPRGTLIAYATSPEKVAADGNGRNGLYTQYLLKYMNEPGLKVEEVFKKVRIAVSNKTGGKQVPWENSSLMGDFYFNGDVPVNQSNIIIAGGDPQVASKAENNFWESVQKIDSREMYKAYLSEYPNGHYASIARFILKKYQASQRPIKKQGTLTIRSNVTGDNVTINGKSYGSTRLDLKLSAGEYELIISKPGYEDYNQIVSITSGDLQTVRGHLRRITGMNQLSASGSNPLSRYGIDMVSISGGSFKMGSPASEQGRDDDEKQHRVTVSDFKINRTEVTLKAFKEFIRATGYQTDAEKDTGGKKGCYSLKGEGNSSSWKYVAGRSYKNPGFKQKGDHPVVCVSHNDAMAYINWLNRTTGKEFRLPTEEEWEYAARGRTTSSRFWGDNPAKACKYANVPDKNFSNGIYWPKKHNCNDGFNIGTAPVGYYLPNAYGLKDMLGNVWEWTCSKYSQSYNGSEKHCSESASVYVLRGGAWSNALASVSVFRGGAWSYVPVGVRSAHRYGFSTFKRNADTGFRLVQVN